MTRLYIKHLAEPTVYAIETDEDGYILAALEVTDEATKGGLCPHLLASLPLAGNVEDVERLERVRGEQYDTYVPECGNAHHLLRDLLALEHEHREAATAFALADSRAKALRKDLELKSAKVHELLARVQDRQPLPLFDAAGV